ncbi:MAG: ATP-binding SpoIIE family protein phosphatase [Vicinamibacterales bacterium]
MEIAAFHRCLAVTDTSEAAAVRFAGRELADAVGFDEEDSYRVGLVATELATNLVKHAKRGEVLLRILDRDEKAAIELIAIDQAHGIGDVSGALADGYSTAGSPGTGLGAVRRLSEVFEIHSTPGRGTIVLARLGRHRRWRESGGVLTFAGVSVPMHGEDVCGDRWAFASAELQARVAVGDGLGHGQHAADAATAAITALDPAPSRGIADDLRAMHEAARHTRGAAAAMAEIVPALGIVRFGGVGNVGAGILAGDTIRHTVSHPGILGHHAAAMREYTYPWDEHCLLVMFSDGLISHWSLKDLPGIGQRHPAVIAAALYRDFSRRRDDVTVVVGRARR